MSGQKDYFFFMYTFRPSPLSFGFSFFPLGKGLPCQRPVEFTASEVLKVSSLLAAEKKACAKHLEL